MLSPQDIENKTFERAMMGGYKPDDVDQFLDSITEDYRSLYFENGELKKKIGILVEKIEEYRKDEEYLRGAILNAQKLSDIASREAVLKSEEIIKDAQEKAEEIINSAQDKYDSIYSQNEENLKKEKDELEKIKHEVSDFKSRLVNMYKQHIELITAMPTFDKEQIEVIEEKHESVEKIEKTETVAEEKELPKRDMFNTETINISEIPITVNSSNDEVVTPFIKSNKVKLGLDYKIPND